MEAFAKKFDNVQSKYQKEKPHVKGRVWSANGDIDECCNLYTRHVEDISEINHHLIQL